MPLTTSTITHTFHNPDGSSATGSVTFQLSKRLTNGTITVLPGEITSSLDVSGNLSQTLVSNVDAGTIPADSTWIVTFRMPPASLVQYSIVVPSGGGTVDLGTLLPQVAIGNA